MMAEQGGLTDRQVAEALAYHLVCVLRAWEVSRGCGALPDGMGRWLGAEIRLAHRRLWQLAPAVARSAARAFARQQPRHNAPPEQVGAHEAVLRHQLAEYRLATRR